MPMKPAQHSQPAQFQIDTAGAKRIARTDCEHCQIPASHHCSSQSKPRGYAKTQAMIARTQMQRMTRRSCAARFGRSATQDSAATVKRPPQANTQQDMRFILQRSAISGQGLSAKKERRQSQHEIVTCMNPWTVHSPSSSFVDSCLPFG